MFFFFFFNDTATTEIYTLSLHDALPIFEDLVVGFGDIHALRNGNGHVVDIAEGARLCAVAKDRELLALHDLVHEDRKSTRLNSSHANISYAVFCLKKKKT